MANRSVAARLSAVLVAAGSLLAVAPAVAQDQPAADQPPALSREEQQRLSDLLRDFIHFTRIARYDVAASYGQQILDSGITPTRFVDLVEASREDESRFVDTIARAMQRPEVEPVAAALITLFEQGKKERVRDPEEIRRNISLLTQGARPRIIGRERLVAAGEYALPQLLEALLQRQDPMLRAEAQRLLIDMGRQAIVPLCTALLGLDPVGQELVVGVLEHIPYKTSLPFLFEAAMKTGSPQVRAAIERATARIGAQGLPNDAAVLYAQLAEGYYDERAELTSFPTDDYQLLWQFDPAIGLVMTAIRTPVYHEAMSMRLAERSLRLRPAGNLDALSLWIAANFSREIDTPPGYANPAYPAERRDAMYFAVAAGAVPSQAVLARALEDRDTPLARRAIAAIERTAGGAGLWEGPGGRAPLLAALRYPSRRVQYEAALAVAVAQPSAPFEGSERVVPILASAIRDAGARFAVVLTADQERYQSLRQILTEQGYTVLPRGATLEELAQPIAEVPGVDLVVTNLGAEATANLIEEIRVSPSLLATPVLALVGPQGFNEVSRRYDRDPTVAIRQSGLSPQMIARAAEALIEVAAGGPIGPEEARDYAARALAAMRDLAVSGNTVLDVADAVLPLVAALGESSGKVRLDVAEIVSRIGEKRAQVALADAALGAEGEERVALLGKVAESAKRFGDMLERRQVQRIIELAQTGDDAEATAAAGLMGALSLPNTNLIPLILGEPVAAR